jgi:pantoate--beta-alanine ligase
MGYFHDGHRSLMRRARQRCDNVVVSLFVNPTQFGDQSDLSAYPRDESRDTELASAEGVDIMFAPSVAEMYPDGFSTSVAVDRLSVPLEGLSRGHEHFRGVATVVAKLFNIVQPDVAFFGQKDAQQTLVIKRMVRDLDFRVQIEVCPTVREADGLAMSSRNVRLGPDAHQQALALNVALVAAETAVRDGEHAAAVVIDKARTVMARSGIEPEYLEIVSTETLDPIERIEGEALIAVAARVGDVRLIDNVVVRSR